MNAFEHPSWWRYAFWIGNPVLVGVMIAASALWLSLVPLIGVTLLTLFVVCLVPMWNTARHVPRRIELSDGGLRLTPYVGHTQFLRWSDITSSSEFPVLGWTARRQTVMLEGRQAWVAFFHDIERFDSLRTSVRANVDAAATTDVPRWWSRLLRLGTF